jgi:hypothetical protein
VAGIPEKEIDAPQPMVPGLRSRRCTKFRSNAIAHTLRGESTPTASARTVGDHKKDAIAKMFDEDTILTSPTALELARHTNHRRSV